RRVVGAGDGDRHRLGRASRSIGGDGDVVGDGERLVGGEEIEGVVGRAEREGNRARARTRAVAAHRGGERRRQHRAQPARQRGTARPGRGNQAVANRVRVTEVDVGEGERARARIFVDRVAGLAREFGDRVWPRDICCQHRRVVGAGDGDRHRFGLAQPITVGDAVFLYTTLFRSGGEEIEGVVGRAEREGNR